MVPKQRLFVYFPLFRRTFGITGAPLRRVRVERMVRYSFLGQGTHMNLAAQFFSKLIFLFSKIKMRLKVKPKMW